MSGMYCLNGTNPGLEDQDTNAATQPLYMVLNVIFRQEGT